MQSEILDILNNKDCNVGHFLISCFKRNPDGISQIDAATGAKETNASVLSRSIVLAKCLRQLGYQAGDVIALSGPNFLNTHIPHYAGMMNGMPFAGVDPTFKYDEILKVLNIIRPKISFCMETAYDDFTRAIEKLNLDTKVLTLDESEHSMTKFIEKHDDGLDIEQFEPATFDTEKIFAWLASTSGTTGVYKMAAITHRTIMDVIRNTYPIYFRGDEFNKIRLMLSPVQWISGLFNVIMIPVSGATILQTSTPTTEHIIDMINEYKPVMVVTSSSMLTYILQNKKDCDLTCFDSIVVTGAKVYKDLLAVLKSRMREDAHVVEAYGQTETLGPILRPNLIIGSCGTPIPWVQLKLVQPETGLEVTEPNTPGELWMKGPRFTEYYNNPEETAKAITNDGWYKTGDILYKDENDNYFFIERFKMLIKYKSYHVYPLELEELIRTIPGVVDVAVTSVEDVKDGEHPVAVVVRQPSSKVTAQEIKDLVASKLSDSKLLRGGVVFVDELPLTSTGKIAQMQLKKLVLNANRE